MNLTKNFALSEFEKSDTAIKKGIDNSIPQEYVLSLQGLAENVLQPVRDKFGPVIITSGYRSPALNKAIGGSQTSQHSKGEAADFKVRGFSNLEVAKWIKENCTFDQLILEFYDPEDENKGWIHCSFSLEHCRYDTLTASKVDGKTVYTKGLGI